MTEAAPDGTLAIRLIAGCATALASSVLTDSGMEHYRGSFADPAMVLPLASSALGIAVKRALCISGPVTSFAYRPGRSRGPSGPWAERPDPLAPRPGGWDGWHLSTGPILIDEPGGPSMFYNGANEDALWQVGWVRLDDTLSRPLERCHGPLIEAPKSPGPSGHRVAFAASVIVAEDALYFTHNDRSVKRARLRRSRPRGII